MARIRNIDYRLLLKVSKLYYEQSLTQSQISNKLSLSRPKVSRLLRQAEDVGIVKHQIIPMGGVYTDLESALEEKFGLIEALVVEISETDSQIAASREVGAAAADYFSRVVSDPCLIGISWGTTLRAMVDSLHSQDLSGSEVVQLIGGLGTPESEAHATYILRKLVSQLGCKLSILNMPGIMDTTSLKRAVLSDSHVREVFKLFPEIDIAFVGIGAATSDSVVMRDGTILTQQELELVLGKGAVGDICLRFFDVEGNPVSADFESRIIGISLDELRNIPKVVGVTGGPHKHESLLGALRGNLISVVVTDHLTAKSVLEV